MGLVTDFRNLSDWAKLLYYSYKTVPVSIEAIKDLQMQVLKVSADGIKEELTKDFPNEEQLKLRIKYLIEELRLKEKDTCLIKFENNGTLLGDKGERYNYFCSKLGDKLGQEYSIRLSSFIDTICFHSEEIHKMIIKLCSFAGINDFKELLRNDTQKTKDTSKNDTQMPKELSSTEAKEIIQKAIQAGLCDNNYKWLKSKALLAYFAHVTSDYLNLGKGEHNGRKYVSWKPFETLFKIKGLSGAKNDYQKTGTFPYGSKDIDKLFK